jgi:cytochrome c/quinol oxidase subunit I
MLASPPINFHVTDTYFVIAHFHHVLFGTIVFSTYAGIYLWFPKMTGGLLDEQLGKLHFWLTFIAFHTTFLVQHWLGDEGMPRRYADYPPTDGFTPGSSGLHVCGPALHTGRPRRPAARNSSQRLGRSGRRRGGAQTRSCGLSRWKVIEPQNILIAFGKKICHNRGVMDPYAVQSPAVTSSQPSCN